MIITFTVGVLCGMFITACYCQRVIEDLEDRADINIAYYKRKYNNLARSVGY